MPVMWLQNVQNIICRFWHLLVSKVDFKVFFYLFAFFVFQQVDRVSFLRKIISHIWYITQFLKFLFFQTLLPRGQYPNRLRKKNAEVNNLLMDYFSNEKSSEYSPVHIVPIHENIIQSDGTISHYIMYDYLHLTDSGYTKVFTPVYDKLCSVIKN